MITLESSDTEVLEEMQKLRVLYKLKKTMRYQTSRPDAHSESVAEHLCAMMLLTQYFLPLEDSEKKLDRTRIDELILFHELGEIETGDIVFHRKNDDQRREEMLAAERVTRRLPASLQKIALNRSREFDECITPEARFVAAIDRLEPIFEMFNETLLPPLLKRLQVTVKINVDYKRKTIASFPYMNKFLDVWEQWAIPLEAISQ